MTAQRFALASFTLGLVLMPLGCGGPASDAGAGAEAAAPAEEGQTADPDAPFDLRQLAAGHRISVKIETARPYTETLPPAEGVPARFEVEGKPAEIGRCASQLVDPERGVKLRIGFSSGESRSTQRGDTTIVVHSGYGDYDVDPPSAYGLREDERLRVDCSQNVPVGRVPRKR
jgi:hypothetical protein